MAKRIKYGNPKETTEQLPQLIEAFKLKLSEESLRNKVLAILPVRHKLRQLGISLLPESITSARDRILYYFMQYPKTIIQGEELAVVAGIEEYARRVRELRVQFGWQIVSGTTAKEASEDGIFNGINVKKVGTDDYILLSTEQDREASFRWNLANSIRKEKTGASQKILKFLQGNVGKVVSAEEVRYVANISEWARRVRELRTEDAWPVISVEGGYILQENKQGLKHDRGIKQTVYAEVLDRDNHQCRKCGWNFQMANNSDPRKRLELHHIEHHKNKGSNETENLISFCNVHHDYVHSVGENWNKEQLFSWLKTS